MVGCLTHSIGVAMADRLNKRPIFGFEERSRTTATCCSNLVAVCPRDSSLS
jgi:hypothetical protein